MKKFNLKLLIIVALGFFIGGCATVDRGNLGPMKKSLNNTEYGYRVVKDFTTTAPTEYIERFEVRPGDCFADEYGGWSDCANDRERSELTEKTKTTQAGNAYWYGWSMYVPSNYTNIYPTKVALGQFHQIGSHPMWMFQNHDGGLYLDKQVTGGYTRDYIQLIGPDELKERWNKIEIHVNWSTKEDGFLKVWVNGKQKVNYKGITMTASKVYFKYGIYRSYLSRYKNTVGTQEVPTQIVYYANVKRGNSREDLLP